MIDEEGQRLIAAAKRTRDALVSEFGNRIYEVNFGHLESALADLASPATEGE